MTSVYEQREDSELLAGFVRRHAYGRVLDVGTGSGVQALAALESGNVKSIIAIDSNPLAVKHLKDRIQTLVLGEMVVVMLGDYFKALEYEQFDTIICNPPYLPSEDNDIDPALYGGPKGYEWTVNFLRKAAGNLAPNGQILLVFSSLTNRERIDLELKCLHLFHELLGELALFFERVYVYRIWGAHSYG